MPVCVMQSITIDMMYCFGILFQDQCDNKQVAVQLQQASQQWMDHNYKPFLESLHSHGWNSSQLYLPKVVWTAKW